LGLDDFSAEQIVFLGVRKGDPPRQALRRVMDIGGSGLPAGDPRTAEAVLEKLKAGMAAAQ
jgi:hypothetical protein